MNISSQCLLESHIINAYTWTTLSLLCHIIRVTLSTLLPPEFGSHITLSTLIPEHQLERLAYYATLFYLFNPQATSIFTLQWLFFLSQMPPRSSKNKSATEKTSVTAVTAPGRQRTLSTKQQLLRKFCIASLWHYHANISPRAREGE